MASPSQRTPKTAQRKSRGGTLVGLFIGLVIGLVCAFGVAWYLQKSPLPFMDKGARSEAPHAPAPGAAPAQLPGKPGEKPLPAAGANGAGEKPRFEFYKILPGGQEAAPKGGDGAAARDDGKTPVADSQPAPVAESFYLQAGAFQKSADADNLKAKLALMGLETSVLEANLPDKGVMYRVRVGPFAKPEEMNRARNQLSQNGIQASVVKVKEAKAQ